MQDKRNYSSAEIKRAQNWMQFFAQTAMAIKGIKFICKIAIFLACLIWVIAIHCNYLAEYHSVNRGLLILHVTQLAILLYILRYGFEKLALLNKYSAIEEMDINREFSHIRSL